MNARYTRLGGVLVSLTLDVLLSARASGLISALTVGAAFPGTAPSTVTVTSSLALSWESVAVSRRMYVPGALKLAVVASA